MATMTAAPRMAVRERSTGSVRREGLVTGLLGAGVVAAFYFLLDLSRGQPLMTPTVLGDVFVLQQPISNGPDATAIVTYTILHTLAFILFGLALTVLVRLAERSALARYAVVQLMVVFLLFFYGLLMIASEQARGRFPFFGVLVANTIAAGVMLVWQWRHHPRLVVALRDAPLGASDEASVPARMNHTGLF